MFLEASQNVNLTGEIQAKCNEKYALDIKCTGNYSPTLVLSINNTFCVEKYVHQVRFHRTGAVNYVTYLKFSEGNDHVILRVSKARLPMEDCSSKAYLRNRVGVWIDPDWKNQFCKNAPST